MTQLQGKLRALDTALSALEHHVVSANQLEMRDVQRGRSLALESKEVRDILNAARAQRQFKAAVSSARAATDLSSRISALRSLARANPAASPRLSMVFGKGHTPSEQEVDDITRELTRLGILKEKDK